MILSLIFLILPSVLTLPKGDSCKVKGNAGVCKKLDDCEYASRLVQVDEKRPVSCSWLEKYTTNPVEVVCCPLKDISYATGEYRDTFSGSNNGVLQSADMSCRYGGDLPILCCNKKPDPPPADEPAACPRIPSPRTAVQRDDLIWRKCLSFQRYIYPCVSSERDPNTLVRNLVCTQSEFTDRVSEGTPANEKEFPHMALLGWRNESTVWGAGGSLISDRYILTAAHVVESHKIYGLVRYALLGSLTKDTRNGLLYNIIQHIPHELYDKRRKYNDIALLKLDRRATLSEFIRPACLPMSNVKLSKYRIVSGWGRIGPNLPLSKILLKTVVTVFNGSKCERSIELKEGWRDDVMICAGDANHSGRDSCQGDSGGPLQAYLDDLNCTYVVDGVVSRGPDCGQGNPAVYTRVEPYVNWIVGIVWPGEK